jgi:site-specific recombinase XerD
MRFLHRTGRVGIDLAPRIIGPVLYAYESIPSALSAEQIAAVLKSTRKDRSLMGYRDYAILMLLSTYGLRDGEVKRLRLEDIDWRAETLHIRHSKTGANSQLPLTAEVGEALLNYLRRGRPKTDAREIFIRTRAPYRPLSSVYGVVHWRLEVAGVKPPGKCGPHTFRHARVVTLLRASVSRKVIGDLLGHRSEEATLAYLKLATEDLRGNCPGDSGGALMRSWPDRNGNAIGRFLRQRRFRHPQTPKTYRRILRGFQDVGRRCERSSSRVSQRTLEVWLQERRAEWSASTVLHSACIINRFLDFLVQEGSIAGNPVAELRTRYCVSSSEAILRALLAPKRDRALEALRQLPRFGSVLGELMRNHVALMRTRGFRYDTNTQMFLRLDRFLQKHPELAREPLPVMLQHYAAARSTAFHAVDCELLRRALARIRHHLDPNVRRRNRITTRSGAFVADGAGARRTDPAQRCGAGPASGAGPTSIAPTKFAFCWTSLVPIRRRVRRSVRSRFIRCSRSSTAPDYV